MQNFEILGPSKLDTFYLFCSYFQESSLPPYFRVFLQELNRHFTQVWLLTNEKTLDEECIGWLQSNGIEVRYYTLKLTSDAMRFLFIGHGEGIRRLQN